MLKHRVIPLLLLHRGGLYKTERFKKPKYVGDPINAIRIFNEKEVDELIVLDIDASREGREPNYGLIEDFASECFMPLAYGGGISRVDQAERLFSLGVEKVCVQTAFLGRTTLVTELAARYGAQAIVVSIDLKRDLFGRPKAYLASTGKSLPTDWLELVKSAAVQGAGELLLNCVDKDGTMAHPDLSVIQQAAAQINIPLIAAGGVASMSDIRDLIEAGASAVAAGAFFVFNGPHKAVLITYPKYDELEALVA